MSGFSKRWMFLMAAIVSLAGAARAQDALPPRVTAELEAMTKAKMRVGACAVSVGSGKELLAYGADELCTPASNMKLLTSCFALARLGGDFRYTTTVYLSGNDVLVKGDYDPVLGDPVVAQATNKSIYAELDLWAKCIVKRLDGRAAGNVIVIGRGGNYRHGDWPRNQYNRWYCAPIAELNFNNNCFDVRFGKKDGLLVPVIAPESRFIQVVNATKPGKGAYSLVNSQDQSQIRLSGTAAFNMTSPVSNAVDNPPMVLGRVLADRIEQAGGKVQGQIKLLTEEQAGLEKAKPIIQTATPLSLVMNRANKRSVNMIAEGMFLRAGDGTFEGSAQLEAQTLRETYGLEADSFSISDGSGFSAGNRVTPRAMVKLLSAVLKRKDSRTLLDTLPVAGVDGTLSKRMDDAPYRGRVLGKTGYIAGVSALSGYVLDAEGRPAAAYSVLVNKCADLGRAKRAEEMVAKALVDWVDGKKETK